MSLQIQQAVNSVVTALTTIAATSTLVLDASKPYGRQIYALTSDVNVWWSQGGSPTAAIGSGSIFTLAGEVVLLDGANGIHVSARAVTGTGNLVLCPIISVK